MFRSGIRSLSCAALLVGLAALPARAETDFDQGKLDAGGIVSEAKAAIKAEKGVEVPGKGIETKKSDKADDSVVRHIVVFKQGLMPGRAKDLAASVGGSVTREFHLINGAAIVAPKTRMKALKANLKSFPEVARIEPDFYQNWLQDTPQTLEQKLPWGIDRVNAQKAWSVTRGKGVKVAVVDTGIDTEHPDLKVAGGFSAIQQEEEDDDPWWWPFDKKASASGGSYKDDQGHGTHVAGTIAGLDNGDGVVGVSPDVTLYAVKVLNSQGSGTFADIISGLEWCVDNGMEVANFSLGASQGTQALQDALAAATKSGLVVIAAADNSGGSVGYPGAYPEAIAVAASDSEGKVASFSSRGPEVDVIAPGVKVLSTYMGGGYKELNGTSMATPHVTGLAALAIAAHGTHDPAQIRKLLLGAASPLADAPVEQQGAGMIDAWNLVRR